MLTGNINTRNKTVATIATTSLLSLSMGLPSLSVAGGLTPALSEGKADIDLRLRHELVMQQGKTEDANALTLRSRIGYTTKPLAGLSGSLQFENIYAIQDSYDTPTNNSGTYPIVADPELSEVNQGYLNYTYKDVLNLKIGRQRIIYDNSRFIGNVGWRQNEQTYDAATLSATPAAGLTTKYAYINNIKSILGTETEIAGHLGNIAYKLNPAFAITAYTYALDYLTGTDSMTMGSNIRGKISVNDSIAANYFAEVANTGDYADNSSGATSLYYAAEAGLKVSSINAMIGYENLSGDGTTSFQTPLATKHKFNGWADKFLATPKDGLNDLYFTLSSMIYGTKVATTAHLFSANNVDASYGKEFDAVVVKKFARIYSAGAKMAYFVADDANYQDALKIWVWTGIKF